MTKYEEALKFEAEAKQIIASINKATGRKEDGTPDPQNDKASFCFEPGMNRREPKLSNDQFAPAILLLHMSYGYYGSRSGYSATSEKAAYAVMLACNKLGSKIAETAKEIVLEQLAKVKAEAKAEAERVLAEVKA